MSRPVPPRAETPMALVRATTLLTLMAAPMATEIPARTPAAIPAESPTVSPGGGLHLIRSDLQFILEQIFISERHAAGEDLLSLLPNSRVPFGLRTVDGSFNNLVQGQSGFGATDDEDGWKKSMDVDLMGVVRATWAAYPHLVASKGSVLTISRSPASAPPARSPMARSRRP